MTLNEYKAKTFSEKPDVKAEYDALAPQYEVIRAEIESRKATGMTQRELAERVAQRMSLRGQKVLVWENK